MTITFKCHNKRRKGNAVELLFHLVERAQTVRPSISIWLMQKLFSESYRVTRGNVRMYDVAILQCSGFSVFLDLAIIRNRIFLSCNLFFKNVIVRLCLGRDGYFDLDE